MVLRGDAFWVTKDGSDEQEDLIDAVAKECELTKEKAGNAVEAILGHIKAAMKNGDEVRLPDFGTFKVAKRNARGPQPRDRRHDQDPRFEGAEVHAVEGPQGRPEPLNGRVPGHGSAPPQTSRRGVLWGGIGGVARRLPRRFSGASGG